MRAGQNDGPDLAGGVVADLAHERSSARTGASRPDW
jgi:hypothetical protein